MLISALSAFPTMFSIFTSQVRSLKLSSWTKSLTVSKIQQICKRQLIKYKNTSLIIE